MPGQNAIDVQKLANCFYSMDIDDTRLNKLFYYSLFDSSTFEEDLFPSGLVVEYNQKLRNLLKSVVPKSQRHVHKLLQNKDGFNEFERRVIAPDTLSRIILATQLQRAGIKATISKDGKYDVVLRNQNVIVELKRMCLWSNYASDFSSFLKKTDSQKNCILVIASTHPFAIDKIVNPSGIQLFNRYIRKLVRSHYAMEHLLTRRNIKMAVEYIDEEGRDDHTLSSLCREIQIKIDGFGG